MKIRTVDWKDNAIKIIDQTRLPGKLEYLYIRDLKALWEAIKELKVRGAPALGGAAGLGAYLGVRDFSGTKFDGFAKRLKSVTDYIASSRPTARNLFCSLERMTKRAYDCRALPVENVKKELLNAALEIMEEDRRACRMISKHGQALIRDGNTVLTICNTGALATIDYGTALGIMYGAREKGKRFKVYACETRPLLQGARLTAWELRKCGIDCTIICDSMAGSLMKQGRIDSVMTGADRIAANGDTANKIGTYSLAVLASYHRVPFYVAAPASTFDTSLATGDSIIIEERPGWEVTGLFFKQRTAPKGAAVYNPAFDVTDNRLIRGIVTERGIARPPFTASIKKMITTHTGAGQ